jgi:hypothetical protein
VPTACSDALRQGHRIVGAQVTRRQDPGSGRVAEFLRDAAPHAANTRARERARGINLFVLCAPQTTFAAIDIEGNATAAIIRRIQR